MKFIQDYPVEIYKCFLLFVALVTSPTVLAQSIIYDIYYSQGGDKENVDLTFTNSISSPVSISGIRVSCGCTVPEKSLAGQVIAPNESMSVPVSISLPLHMSRRTSRVFIDYNIEGDNETRTKEFTLQASRPEIVSLSPRILHWRLGEEVVPKVVEIELKRETVEGLIFDRDSLVVAGEAFDFEVISESDDTMLLAVVPRAVGAAVNSRLSFTVQVNEEHEIPFHVHLMVR